MKRWLVVEGNAHGIRLAPDAAFDVIPAETAREAAKLYEESHDGPLERLFVFSGDYKAFDVRTVVEAVPE